MPAQPARLRHGRDISAAFRSGGHRAGRLVVVHARRRGDGRAVRVAVIASRRVGTAVRRNRAKRLLREAVRHLRPSDGVDLVLVARPAAAEVDRWAVEQELAALLGRLGVLEDPSPLVAPGCGVAS